MTDSSKVPPVSEQIKINELINKRKKEKEK